MEPVFGADTTGWRARDPIVYARHLLSLINDILDISKIEAGKMTVENINCDLPQLVAEVVSLMRPRATEKGLRCDATLR